MPKAPPHKKPRTDNKSVSRQFNGKAARNGSKKENHVKLSKRSKGSTRLETLTPQSLRGIVDAKGKAKEDTAVHQTSNASAVAASTASNSGSPSRASSFKIIAGSYEKLLYGLECTFESSLEPSTSTQPVLKLTPIFIFPAHVGSVKSVAASPAGGKWLATGSSADEIVKIWDLRRRKEVGGLLQHEGSITALAFPTSSHLVSCSEDGTICLFRTKDWAVLRVLKGHKGRINSIAVHPSGKVALSVGKDRTIRMWDFMRGKGAGSTKIYKEAELVRWSPNGMHFVVQTLHTIDIFSTSMTLLHQINHTARIQDIQFVICPGTSSREVLLVAAEDKKVTVYEDMPQPNSAEDESKSEYKAIATFIGHDSRVKALATLPIALPTGAKTIYMSTIGSDGKINLYDLAAISAIPSMVPAEPTSITPITSYDTKGSRLTCLAMADGEAPVQQVTGKRKRVEEIKEDEWTDFSDDDDEEDDSKAGLASDDGDENEEGWGGLEGESD